ncbi:MAG: hypothetical protein LJE93_07525 [Acidobacteria bacterium]|jgi:hypothetical protein|nr:hypothetical protein [Acidobacteriota bacterium]
MDYLEILRRRGWLSDPGERVRVVAVHARDCPARNGGLCRCEPRLVLAASLLPRRAEDDDRDLPMLHVASGE